jgi:hypothetical protein
MAYRWRNGRTMSDEEVDYDALGDWHALVYVVLPGAMEGHWRSKAAITTPPASRPARVVTAGGLDLNWQGQGAACTIDGLPTPDTKERIMTEAKELVRLAGSLLSRSCHVCAFFHSKEEEYRVLMPFIKDGFERGDRAFHVVDPNHRADHLRRLEREGIDVSDAEANGQLEVRRWQEAYIKDDHFDQYRMIETIKEALDPSRRPPGRLTRLVANMEWALEDLPGVHDIVEYETRLNLVLPEYHDPVVCTYDLSRFDASVVVDIMRTHPMVIVGGILQENPFYVPPDEMLRELKERAAEAA